MNGTNIVILSHFILYASIVYKELKSTFNLIDNFTIVEAKELVVSFNSKSK